MDSINSLKKSNFMKMKCAIFLCFIISNILILNNGLTSACDKLASGLNAAQKKKLLDAHNNDRLLIARGQVKGQPRGINLRRMVWDNKLSQEAQKISETCVFKHVPVHDGRWSVGQNLWQWGNTSPSATVDVAKAVESWFNEHQKYTYSNKFSTETGHYTQVVWANSKYLGCGYTKYKSGQFYQHFIVCNYGPAGNIIGSYPYKTGKSGCENLC